MMVVAEVEDGKLRRLYGVTPDGDEADFPIDAKTKVSLDAHGALVSLRLRVDRVIDITD